MDFRLRRARGNMKGLVGGRVGVQAHCHCRRCRKPDPAVRGLRQIIWEYCGDVEVVFANLKGKRAACRMSALFPRPFDGRFLNK